MEAQRSAVAHIEDAGWHWLKMINEVLDLLRAEAGAEGVGVPRARPVVG